jgi:hypothetical protein
MSERNDTVRRAGFDEGVEHGGAMKPGVHFIRKPMPYRNAVML